MWNINCLPYSAELTLFIIAFGYNATQYSNQSTTALWFVEQVNIRNALHQFKKVTDKITGVLKIVVGLPSMKSGQCSMHLSWRPSQWLKLVCETFLSKKSFETVLDLHVFNIYSWFPQQKADICLFSTFFRKIASIAFLKVVFHLNCLQYCGSYHLACCCPK